MDMLGIKTGELPVIEPTEYARPCTALKGQGTETCDWSTIGRTFEFNQYSYIKHELKKITVETKITWNEYVTGGTVYIRMYWSDNNGSSWTQFGSEYSTLGIHDWTTRTFTDTVLTTLDKPFDVRIQCKIVNNGSVEGNAIITLYIRDFELSERAFRSQRADI